MSSWLALACPKDHQPINANGDRADCQSCGSTYARVGNIWRFLSGEQDATFLDVYHAVRRSEGWGAVDADYYRRLPFVLASDPQRDIWRVRAASFRALMRLNRERQRVLDLGAGNGWLAYQLTRRGHSVAAVDLSDDEFDGLGAFCHYPVTIDAYQADGATLPFADAQFDLVVFNASLHYARHLVDAVGESLRVLAPSGALVVMDSPLYQNPASGRAMLEDKRHDFKDRLGLEMANDAVGFLTFADFAGLGRTFALGWQWIEPFVDVHWASRHWRARWRGQREPARFGLMVGRRI